MNIGLVGNIILNEDFLYNNNISEFINTKDLDLLIGNLGTVIVDKNITPWMDKQNTNSIDSSIINGNVVQNSQNNLKHFDYLSLANDHIYDYGTIGLISTKVSLIDMDIKSSGIGFHLEDSQTPSIIYDEKHNKHIIIFSMSNYPKWWAAGTKVNMKYGGQICKDMDGIWYINPNNTECKKNISKIINKYKKLYPQGIFIISVHWTCTKNNDSKHGNIKNNDSKHGNIPENNKGDDLTNFIDFLIKQNITILHLHGDVKQEIKIINDTLAICSLNNFYGDTNNENIDKEGYLGMIKIDSTDNKISGMRLCS